MKSPFDLLYRLRQGVATLMGAGALFVVLSDDWLIYGYSFGLVGAFFYLTLGMAFLFLKRYHLMFVSLACSALISFRYGELAHPQHRMMTRVEYYTNETGVDSAFVKKICQKNANFIAIRPVSMREDSLLKIYLYKRYPYHVSYPQPDQRGWAWFSTSAFEGCDTLSNAPFATNPRQ